MMVAAYPPQQQQQSLERRYEEEAYSSSPEELGRRLEGCQEDEEGKKATRKGKWTIEEEEFTTRIIEYFNSGLLELPDGTTLRSYLAEKLNCDPMRITKKFSGTSSLGKRVFHSSTGRQREERMNRVASSQTLAAAHRELNILESRFKEAIARASESKDSRMIDLQARFFHSSNVVSTPAIDAFIMQSCGGALWDPDGVASGKEKNNNNASISQQALQQATATHLAIDPTSYALEGPNGLIHQDQQPPVLLLQQRQPNEAAYTHAHTPHTDSCTQIIQHNLVPATDLTQHNTVLQQQQQQQQQQYAPYMPQPQYYVQPQQSQQQLPNGYYVQEPFAYHMTQFQKSEINREAQFHHLVRQQHDPAFINATRVSHDQHQADQARISRWMANSNAAHTTNVPANIIGTIHFSNANTNRLGATESRVLGSSTDGNIISTSIKNNETPQAACVKTEHDAPPLPFPAPPPQRQLSAPPSPASPSGTKSPRDSVPLSQPAVDTNPSDKQTNAEAAAGGLLLGFVKKLERSESHNELVDFVEDVNEKVADSRKRCSQTETESIVPRKRQTIGA